MKSYKHFMEGYVASADKKPAKDGRMLPARKIQTNDRPADKAVAEKMDMKKADMGDVIKDFQDSDAPQFKGKSKEKRREMAIAAKLSAEELSAKQKKIDKNNNGKIDGDDLRKLRGEEMTPAQKAARLALIKKTAAKLNKRAEMDAKRAMRRDPVLGKRKSDPADHDLVHKEAVETMSHDHAKQAAHEIAKSHKNLKVTSHGNDHFVHHKDEQDGDHIHVHAKDGHIHVDHSVGVMGGESKHKSVADAVKHGKKVGGLSENYIVKYHNPKSEKHGSEKHFTDQSAAQKHAERGNSVDKTGGKYVVHKADAKGHIKEATPNKQQVKQAIGIARDKRYAGGNMTGAVKTMNKINKGLAQHPAVSKELQKQNESVIVENDEMEKKEMMLTQLHFICYAAEEIMEYVKMGGRIEEWYQNKMSKVHSDMETLHAYMEGTARKDGIKEELDSQESDVDYDRKPTFAEFISKLNK